MAVANNGGKMPVLNWNGESDKHLGFDNKSEIKYFWLSDIIKIDLFKNYYSMTSLGDLFLVAGILGSFSIMFYIHKELKRKK